MLAKLPVRRVRVADPDWAQRTTALFERCAGLLETSSGRSEPSGIRPHKPGRRQALDRLVRRRLDGREENSNACRRRT